MRIPLICAYPVFSVDKCEGVRVPQRDTRKLMESPSSPGVVEPVVARRLAGGLRFGGDAAFYAPGAGVIQLPPVESFASVDGFRGGCWPRLIN